MKKRYRHRCICLAVLMTFLISCDSGSTSSENGSDPQAEKIVKKAIENSGGIDKWKNIEKLSFKKKTTTYDSLGNIIIDKEEAIELGLNSPFTGIIAWMEGDNLYRIEHQPGSTVMYKNNQPFMSESWSLVEKVNAAAYTVGMPYKLLDDGNQLSVASVNDNTFRETSFKIPVDNKGSDDTWWYFFGKESLAFHGSMVKHSPTYALIVNESFQEVQGLKFVEKRKSFRVDKEANRKYLVAKYHYYDYKIEMRQPR